MIRVAIIGEQEVDELKLIPAFGPEQTANAAEPARSRQLRWSPLGTPERPLFRAVRYSTSRYRFQIQPKAPALILTRDLRCGIARRR